MLKYLSGRGGGGGGGGTVVSTHRMDTLLVLSKLHTWPVLQNT